jgi:hypothetical protein
MQTTKQMLIEIINVITMNALVIGRIGNHPVGLWNDDFLSSLDRSISLLDTNTIIESQRNNILLS